MTGRAIVITACDSGFFELASELIASLQAVGLPEGVVIGCMDLGLTDEQRATFEATAVAIAEPKTLLKHSFVGKEARRLMSYLARPFLRETFPGYKTYVWLDADTWVQSPKAVQTLVETAERTGSALIHERERSYDWRFDLAGWRTLNFLRGYGYFRGLLLAVRAHINNGVFALRADAPHWEPWRSYHQEGLDRTGRAAPFDQFGLNAAVRFGRIPTTFLPATFNWIVDLRAPVIDAATGLLCSPDASHRPIEIIHLAGDVKKRVFALKVTDGSVSHRRVRYGSTEAPNA